MLDPDGTGGDFQSALDAIVFGAYFFKVLQTKNRTIMKKSKSTSEFSGNLFEETGPEEDLRDAPLSARMRPRNLEEIVGQEHILAEGKLLRRAVKADRLISLILYGPPGTGKTTLARCVSRVTRAHFESINAVASNVEEMRSILAGARHRYRTASRKTILFIDEIHRFNKAQQDVLMPDLEAGHVILIGATIFNPFFSLIGPLLSRSMIFELKPLSKEAVLAILRRALGDRERGLGGMAVEAEDEGLRFLAEVSEGDARRALNALEIGCLTTKPDTKGVIHFSISVAEESIQKKQVRYDKKGDAHYDTASAFIKSMRGSDPDAALYWLAKMLYAGEDHRFIARRICICAAEDVGNADPQALVVANAALQICEFVGLPEARIPLAQAAVYIACAPKSNAAYMGLEEAAKDVAQKRVKEVPEHLKDASYPGAKKLGRGENYKYAHNFKDHYVDQEYMPEAGRYYRPADLGFERRIREWLAHLRKQKSF